MGADLNIEEFLLLGQCHICQSWIEKLLWQSRKCTLGSPSKLVLRSFRSFHICKKPSSHQRSRIYWEFCRWRISTNPPPNPRQWEPSSWLLQTFLNRRRRCWQKGLSLVEMVLKVLPVKSHLSEQDCFGVVHDTSASGNTVYMNLVK